MSRTTGSRRATARRALRGSPWRWVVLAAVGVGALLTAAPFLLLVLNAFKSSSDYSQNGPLAWPTSFSLEAFEGYLARVDFPLALWNSVTISVVVAFLGVTLGLLAAYALGIGRVRGNTAVVAVLLLATMLPHEALIYPLFYGAQALGLLNSVWSVVIVFVVLQGAFATYLLSSVMSTVPRSLLEAAALDGANRRQVLWRVVAPILLPTMSVLVVFFFIWTWNEFYIPLVLLADPASQTVPIALSTLRGQHSIDITVVNAGSLLSLIPTVIFFVLFQRTLSRGVTAGAIK
ncbi:carbohydrate ABC transporter permease [Myceligenerans pegani]|uniref:Carbohydrate ABC transporter permease n=1 Tax=Myceligenerans pegani TaxID=2776917 RepID=A0ABR9MZW7_9MICO|nr:carbohydrate ABC transporter permease [Myceligenerans sp. TRM 65318]MBE1876640.1 carbohydrate ABC transporter permease [Myceligenerans sp. TRM 65318]MBE3018911.1 carbohydrate ABC transporter permease [Myceligenerans sp. TRM 65318]